MKRDQLAALTKCMAHPARTAVAAAAAVLAARALRLPELYWAPISTMIVMQANLDAALSIAWRRLAGTALGAVAGTLIASWAGAGVVTYGAGVFAIGLLCAAPRLDRAAYRFAGITMTIVMFVAQTEPAWVIGIHRFCEVSVGIVVGVIVIAIWPDTRGEPGQIAAPIPPHPGPGSSFGVPPGK